jgi:hypothetical protein
MPSEVLDESQGHPGGSEGWQLQMLIVDLKGTPTELPVAAWVEGPCLRIISITRQLKLRMQFGPQAPSFSRFATKSLGLSRARWRSTRRPLGWPWLRCF